MVTTMNVNMRETTFTKSHKLNLITEKNPLILMLFFFQKWKPL